MKNSYLLNEKIKVPEVRVIDEKGKQLGVVPTEEALALAREKDLDLIEVAPLAKPPVAKILDFQRFLFQRKKQEKTAARKGRSELKEFRIRPNIGNNDLEIRVERARKFLQKGDRVKLTVVFRGREMTHLEVGLVKIKKMIDLLKEVGLPEKEPERLERTYEVVINPLRRSSG